MVKQSKVSMLEAVQTRFMEAVLQPENLQSLSWVQTAPQLTAEQQLNIYRNNLIATRTKILSTCFKVCCQIVGHDCFEAVAHAYYHLVKIQALPLEHYGSQFAAFLDEFEPLKTLPYLGAMARLEWAHEIALCGAYADALSMARLQQLLISDYTQVKFEVTPTLTRFHSHFPVLEIWQQHQQPHFDAPFYFERSDYWYVVYKQAWDVILEPITQAEHDFLDALSMTSTFEQACQRCLAQHPDLDIVALFTKATMKGWITGFTV